MRYVGTVSAAIDCASDLLAAARELNKHRHQMVLRDRRDELRDRAFDGLRRISQEIVWC